MNSGYHKNLVFTAACIGMCFFGVSMITLGSVLPSLVTKLELSGLQTTSLVTFLPIGMLAGSLIFGPVFVLFHYPSALTAYGGESAGYPVAPLTDYSSGA